MSNWAAALGKGWTRGNGKGVGGLGIGKGWLAAYGASPFDVWIGETIGGINGEEDVSRNM